MNTAVTALLCKWKKNLLYICLHSLCSDIWSGHAAPHWSEIQKSYAADTLSMRGLLLHSWHPCAACINRQGTESQLTYLHLSSLTPSSTANRLKPSTLQCSAGEGRWRDVRGSVAGEGVPAELASKGTWSPGKGTGDLQKPPELHPGCWQRTQQYERGEHASCCLQTGGQHTVVTWGPRGFVLRCKPALGLNTLIWVLSLKKGSSSAPRLNLWKISLFISRGSSGIPSFWSSIKWRIMVPWSAVSGSPKISWGMLRQYKPIDCRPAILKSFSQKL